MEEKLFDLFILFTINKFVCRRYKIFVNSLMEQNVTKRLDGSCVWGVQIREESMSSASSLPVTILNIIFEYQIKKINNVRKDYVV